MIGRIRLNDDYVKFIRYGQQFIERNGSGILAFINPHGFLDNSTFRGMRWHLLNTFDKIYTIDLNGNNHKPIKLSDGTWDENIFEIEQGVSINFFIKTGKKQDSELGKVYHTSIIGKKEEKLSFALNNTISSISFTQLFPEKPELFFVPKSNLGKEKYSDGFSIKILFKSHATGIVTARDHLAIDFNNELLEAKINHFIDTQISDDEIRATYFGKKKSKKYKPGDTRGWQLEKARKLVKSQNRELFIKSVSYRPFDERFIYYNTSLVDWGREKFMNSFIAGENIGLCVCRQLVSQEFTHALITDKIIDDSFISNKSKERTYLCPLYIYSPDSNQQEIGNTLVRIPNFDITILKSIEEKLGLILRDIEENDSNSFRPIDLLDYIYAVLYCPTYRKMFQEFLRTDFPKIPYPANKSAFWDLVKLGTQLRSAHLFDFQLDLSTGYDVDGDNLIDNIYFQDECVWINSHQYFSNIPYEIWEMNIGGYQPSQKWLKDRKGRRLGFDELIHYQKMISTLKKTKELMASIDKVFETSF